MAAGWISKAGRATIYNRDEMVCCYCGKTCKAASVQGMTRSEQAAHMKANYADIVTLDHIVSQKELAAASTDDADFNAKRRDPKNLVTVCNACNSSKKATPLYVWCAQKNLDYGVIIAEIARRIAIAA